MSKEIYEWSIYFLFQINLLVMKMIIRKEMLETEAVSTLIVTTKKGHDSQQILFLTYDETRRLILLEINNWIFSSWLQLKLSHYVPHEYSYLWKKSQFVLMCIGWHITFLLIRWLMVVIIKMLYRQTNRSEGRFFYYRHSSMSDWKAIRHLEGSLMSLKDFVPLVSYEKI